MVRYVRSGTVERSQENKNTLDHLKNSKSGLKVLFLYNHCRINILKGRAKKIPKYVGIGNTYGKNLLISDFDEMNLNENKVNITNVLKN